MNRYSVEFFGTCPSNGDRIKYELCIESQDVIRAEEIILAVDGVDTAFHEEIADEMVARFGGVQFLKANHRGVLIETTRRGSSIE